MPRHSTQLTAAIDTRLRTKQGKEKRVPATEAAESALSLPAAGQPRPASLLPATADFSFLRGSSSAGCASRLPGGSIVSQRVDATQRLSCADSMSCCNERQQQAAAPSRRCQTFYCFSFFVLLQVPGARAGCAFQRQDWITSASRASVRVCVCVPDLRVFCT